MRQPILWCVFWLAGAITLYAQEPARTEKTEIDGSPVLMVISDGDTVYIADLDMYTITSLKDFETNEEYNRYMRYRSHAVKVYPYAREAIRIFREMELDTEDMSRRKRKKHIKQLEKELESKFEEPLKKLTRTQGQIMVKMIEKELNTPFYSLVKDLKGFGSAFYWNTMGYFYGYKLKHGYKRGEDPVLDAVLDDFDISYRIDRRKYMEQKKAGK